MESHGDARFAASAKLATSSAANGNLPVRRGAGRHRDDKGALRMMFGMRVRGGLLATLIMFAVPAAATLGSVFVSAPAAAQTVASITVEGNRRVEIETIRSYFKPGPGGRLGQAEIDDGLKALIETGLFQDVQDQPGRRPHRRGRGRKFRDRPHRVRRQQEGQGRAAFGGNPVQAARHVLAADGSVGCPAHRRNLPAFGPL